MKSGQRLEPGHLMTGEERRILRDLQNDLEQQHARAATAERRSELGRQLGSIQRERELDRDLRRRVPRKTKRGER